jgi:hypothetical protein
MINQQHLVNNHKTMLSKTIKLQMEAEFDIVASRIQTLGRCPRIIFNYTFLVLAACVCSAIAEPKPIFEVRLEDFNTGSLVCQVTFSGELPPPATVDKLVRDSLQSAALVEPSRNIVGMAFHGDDKLNGNQYSGTMIYRADHKRIMTLDESSGVKTTATDTGAYYVELKEKGTLAGIKPERKWLSLSIVFPTQPSAQEALDASIAEIQKHKARGLDINAVPMIGDKKINTSWKQMVDPNGGWFHFRYTVADHTLYNKDAVIKRLP